MDTIDRLAAYEAIRQVAARYSRGVDRLDLEIMQSAYWPGATDDHGTYIGEAMAFCEHVVESHRRFDATMHCNLNHAIEVADDGLTATGEIYNTALLFRKDADGTALVDQWWGRYLDRYEQRDGEWRIAYRTCVHEATRSTTIDQAMPIAIERFQQGGADRGTHSPLGPGEGRPC